MVAAARVTGATILLACAVGAPAEQGRQFTATGYAIAGRTASGTTARPGIVAADPAVLPLGARIRVSRAGTASGDYVVEDTGPGVRGRHIDIFFPTEAEARRFGRRRVIVDVLPGALRPPADGRRR